MGVNVGLHEVAVTLLLYLVAAFLAIDIVLLGVLLVQRLCLVPDATVLDLGPFIIAAGVLVALLTYTVTLRRGRSEDLLKAATDLLEKAYQALAPPAGSRVPPNDRFVWLSAARLIRTAENLGDRITETSHKLIYREKREYWRTRLYELIFPSREGLPSTFYAEKPEHMIGYVGEIRAPLSEKSLTVLYRFIRWPDGVPDPIGEEPNFSETEIEHMRAFGPRGLGELLGHVQQLRRPPAKQ